MGSAERTTSALWTELAPGREHAIGLPDGRTLSYVALGAEDGPTVVVLDGPGSRGLARAMHSTAERLGVRLIAADRPGYGRSTPAPDRTIVGLADDMAALTDTLGLDRFGLLGQSGGTPYALVTAQRFADRVYGLALIGGLVPLGEPDALEGVRGPMLGLFKIARRAPWLLKPVIRLGARQTMRDVEKAGDRFVKDAPRGDKAALEDPVLRAIHLEAMKEVMSRPDEFATEARLLVKPWGFDLADTKVPTALWVGEGDVTHPPVMARKLAARLADGTPVHVVPDAATFGMRVVFEDVLRFCAPAA